MSYDLHVYAPRRLSADELRALVSDNGLSVDDDEPGESLTVIRGAPRGYSFTLGLPVPAEVEDVPEEVSAVLLDTAFLYEVLVEGSSPTHRGPWAWAVPLAQRYPGRSGPVGETSRSAGWCSAALVAEVRSRAFGVASG